MDDLFERKVGRLVVVSPLHIGGTEQRRSPFEYVEKDGYVYHISDDRLSLFLFKHDLIDRFVREIELEGHRFRLKRFFEVNKIPLSEKNLVDISGGRRAKLAGDPRLLQDYRPLIRDGMGRPFIPGTSLKGVIRTAVLSQRLHVFKEEDRAGFDTQVVEKIERSNPKQFKRKYAFPWIQGDWLEKMRLSNKSQCPNTDWLRMLHVTDAYPTTPVETRLIPIKILKREGGGWVYKKEPGGADTTIWVETIPEGCTVEFGLTWDRSLLRCFDAENPEVRLPRSLDEIARDVNAWAARIVRYEKEFASGHDLCKWYNANQNCTFRIGFASGMGSTTIIGLLPQTLRQKIRNWSSRDRGDAIAPKSRRVWLREGTVIPLGWADFSMLQFDESHWCSWGTGTTNPEIPPEKHKSQATDGSMTGLSAYSEAGGERTPVQKGLAERTTWKHVLVVWRPQDQVLSVLHEGKKAHRKVGLDQSFIDESILTRLKKKRSVIATVIVEPQGNDYRIVEVRAE